MVAMERLLDVSELEPCEPLERTLEAARALPGGDYLRVIHRREPHLLYPLLEQAGLRWRTRRGGRAGYEILIWRHQDETAAEQVRAYLDAC